jgi:hypothetical protein
MGDRLGRPQEAQPEEPEPAEEDEDAPEPVSTEDAESGASYRCDQPRGSDMQNDGIKLVWIGPEKTGKNALPKACAGEPFIDIYVGRSHAAYSA